MRPGTDQIRFVLATLVALATLVVPAGAQHLEGARNAFREGRYQEAITSFSALAGRTAPSAEASRGLMRALAEVGRYHDAVEAAERFQRSAPRSPEVWTALGEVLALTGRIAAAESCFSRAVAGGASDALTARLRQGEVLLSRGRSDEARRVFDDFIDVYNRGGARSAEDLTAVGTAARHLAVYDPQLAKDALRAYDQAMAADSTDWEPHLAAGALFLERYNGTEARAAFEAVIRRNPRHPRALLGLARTEEFEGSAAAAGLLEKSLAVNPSLVPARVALAQLLLESEEYDRAASEIERALAVNPASLEALAVQAGIRFLERHQDALEEVSRQALTLNPRFAGLYTTLAELSARSRRYQEAVRFAQRAVAVDSRSWRGYALLGINQLRLGIADSARAHLETAFRGDPYDVWTKNTLDLLDKLDRFETVSTRRFQFLIDGKESQLLALYFGPLAEEAYEALAARYGYRPATPIRVEVYPTHADFSVRTIGLVGLGALGVSFGPVIAMDSPSARRLGEFNWGSTLWHEIAHSFHAGMTGQRVPRWFTEGLAVYEERRARPGWGERVSPAFLAAFAGGRLRAVRDLNEGFVRPAYPEQVGFSYYQASLVCELIDREWGTAALLDMLRGYRDGLATPAVVDRILGEDLEALERRFERYVQERFGGALASLRADRPPGQRTPTDEEWALRARNPRDYAAQVAMGRRLLERGDLDRAAAHFERAKALFPEYAGPESPYEYLARIHRQRGDRRREAAELAVLADLNGRDHRLLLAWATGLEQLGDTTGAAGALERALYIAPAVPEVHQRLAALSETLGRPEVAVRERQAILALRPANRADALYDLARAYYLAGDLDHARRWVLRALEEAPGFEEAQTLLLTIHERRARNR